MLLVVLSGQQHSKPAASVLSDLPQWWRKGYLLDYWWGVSLIRLSVIVEMHDYLTPIKTNGEK